MKKIFITLDTEMDFDIHWNKPQNVTFSSVVEGIPTILRPIWDKLDVNPVYFVTQDVVKDNQSYQVLLNEVEKGAIIGTHFHPERMGDEYFSKLMHPFPHAFADCETEKNLILQTTQFLTQKFGKTPTWYRAGRFGADEDSFSSLKGLGYKADFSVTPGISWAKKGGVDFSGWKNDKQIMNNGLIEFPVTITGSRLGFVSKLLTKHWLSFAWLRPTHMTYFEQAIILRKAKKQGIENLVLMFHSMEVMINKTPYVRSKSMQKYFLWRLEKTIKLAKKLGYATNISEDAVNAENFKQNN